MKDYRIEIIRKAIKIHNIVSGKPPISRIVKWIEMFFPGSNKTIEILNTLAD